MPWWGTSVPNRCSLGRWLRFSAEADQIVARPGDDRPLILPSTQSHSCIVFTCIVYIQLRYTVGWCLQTCKTSGESVRTDVRRPQRWTSFLYLHDGCMCGYIVSIVSIVNRFRSEMNMLAPTSSHCLAQSASQIHVIDEFASSKNRHDNTKLICLRNGCKRDDANKKISAISIDILFCWCINKSLTVQKLAPVRTSPPVKIHNQS